MVNSISLELKPIDIPFYEGKLRMVPFDLSDLLGVPDEFVGLVENMVDGLPVMDGVAFLTIDGRTVEKDTTQRRGGVHIDGNYLGGNKGWGGGGWKSVKPGWSSMNPDWNGWKDRDGDRNVFIDGHKKSYECDTGGMLIASTYPGCKGWNGVFEGSVGIGGDCSGLQISGEGFVLKPNTLYYGNSQFVHESLPIDRTVHRVLARITLPCDYPVLSV